MKCGAILLHTRDTRRLLHECGAIVRHTLFANRFVEHRPAGPQLNNAAISQRTRPAITDSLYEQDHTSASPLPRLGTDPAGSPPGSRQTDRG